MTTDRTRSEFTRQATTMAAAPVFNAQELLDAIAEASAHGPGRTILDVGCGPAIVTAALAQRGGSVVGIDLTPRMLQQAADRCAGAGLHNVEFVLAPAEHLPFPAAHFDAAVSRFALHHVPNPAAVVAEMARVVKPGGSVVLADATSSENPDDSRLHNALETLRDPSHVRMLPPSELLAIARAAGLHLLHRRDFDQPRQFDEWMRIVNAPDRERPLQVILQSLAATGHRAGINLLCHNALITFTHRLVMLTLGQ